MARKKVEIQKDWDKADMALMTAIQNGMANATDNSIATAEEKFKAWNVLLKEADEKISKSKWDGEQSADREAFRRYVVTQKDKSAPRFAAQIEDLKDRLKGAAVTKELITNMDTVANHELQQIAKTLQMAKGLIAKGETDGLFKSFGQVTQDLKKKVAGYSTKENLKQRATELANIRKCNPKYVNADDPKIQAYFSTISTAYRSIMAEVASLDDQVSTLFEKHASKKPDTNNSDPVYRKHLEDLQGLYKAVADETKQRLANLQTHVKKIDQLDQILARTVPGNAHTIAPGVVAQYKTLVTEFSTMENNVQKKIREKQSEYPKLAAEWKLSAEDLSKTLWPLRERIFALNQRGGELYHLGVARLRGILQELVKKFNDAAAANALSTVVD